MAAPKLGEFERIARFFAPLAAPEGLGLLDDVAVIPGPPGEEYVLKTDAIVEGVHFLPEDPADQVAQKLLRVNLSDLAGKGAVPVGYLLTTALPRARDEAWLERFAQGLARDQKEFGIGLLGGDSVGTTGPVTLSVAAVGRVRVGETVLRSGARAGDAVFVSGTLGDGALCAPCAVRWPRSAPLIATFSPTAIACRGRGYSSDSGSSAPRAR
jgi:thiamine-monophosphate kinase